MNPLKHRIIIPENMQLEALHNEIQHGGRFLVFPYCISVFFAVTTRRFSPAIFVPYGASTQTYQTRYNRISYILGWWGIPWGPVRTLQCVRINRNGGIDVTEDILLNIDENCLRQREVVLHKTSMLFTPPEGSERQSFEKAILKKLPHDPELKKLVVGLYLNTAEGEAPVYTIGLRTAGAVQHYQIEAVRKALYTQFYKRVPFVFTNLDEANELNGILEKQGLTIISR